MEMQASRTLAVTQQQAWEALNDPEVLKLCIPGCDKVVTQAEPKLVWLATQLTDAQIRNLQKKQASSNADWKEEWVDLLIRQALFVNLARAEVSKPLDGLKLNGIGTLQ